MSIESFYKKFQRGDRLDSQSDQESNSKQEDRFLGYSPEEVEKIKKAEKKYKTPEDLLGGIGWAKKGPGKAKPQYHITPSAKQPKK